jgi:hypothetical protein
MTKFTNISSGPRGIRTKDGLVMVEAGQTIDADLADGETAAEEWFAKAGSAAAKEAVAAHDEAEHPTAHAKGSTK